MSRPYLSACLCFRNSGAYLAEWLAFYTVLGVEHFYLYNNDSADDFAFAIAPYVRRRMATLINHPGRGVQHAVYAHCLQEFGPQTKWMIFCDDDEFLFPVTDASLPEALVPYEGYAGVGVAWMMYGSSGHTVQPKGLVIENYLRRAALPDPHVKCIVRPEQVVEPVVAAHQFRTRGALMVDEKFHPLRGPFAPQPTGDTLRINHYCSKSHAELLERKVRREQVNTGLPSPLSPDEYLKLESGWNDVEDRIASRYVSRVNQAIEAARSA